MNSVRIWFKKTGLAVYISHLDMNRCMSRAVIRARIPLWYTEGFNPKPYLNFLNPLALGQEGLREPMDIRLEGEITPEEIKNRLNSVMPAGIEILEVTEPVMKTAQISSAAYSVKLEFASGLLAEGFCAKAKELIAGGELQAEKKSKRGVKTVNLCEMVRGFDCVSEGSRVSVTMLLPTGSALSLNPDLLLDTLISAFGNEEESRKITRTALYNTEGELFK